MRIVEYRKKIRFWLLQLVVAGAVATQLFAQTTAAEWTITLRGTREDSVNAADFKAAKAHPIHEKRERHETKGHTAVFSGLPFAHVVAMVDGSDAEHPYDFNQEAWKAGYEITVTASDGYAATFDTAEVPYDALLLADEKDGKPVKPRLVGEIGKQLWVKDISAIELHLGPVAAEQLIVDPDFRLILEAGGVEHEYSLPELEYSPHYIAGPGSYTTSAGTTYTNTYGGVVFADLLRDYVKLKADDTVTVTAADGYQMSYSAAEIMDDSEGTWILAIKMDGEFIPKDPGYIRTVKVGPDIPNIDGHSSVKMITKLSVSGKAYRNFELLFSGRMDTVIDRQTIQSGISCHEKIVHFKRKDTEGAYRGIPLWRLIAYSDDPRYAPHRQDSSIISYNREAARAGYTIELVAADGFVVRLDSRQIDGNEDVILAMYKDGRELADRSWPLILVWDTDASRIPDGIKPIRQVKEIRLVFD